MPIYQTTSYVFNDTEHAANLFSLAEPGNIYTRIMNPTQSVFEERVAALEGGVGALAVASGSAAITYAVLNLTYAGDNIVALSTLYGGTYALFAHTLPQFGIEVRFVDPEKPEELAPPSTRRPSWSSPRPSATPRSTSSTSAPGPTPRTPRACRSSSTTPRPRRTSRASSTTARTSSVHSATKYIGGHGTSIGGVIVDSGNFDWAAHAERFPGLTGPDGAYHGVVWTEAVGNLAYIIRARTVLLRNTGAAIDPVQQLAVPAGPRDPAPAHGASQRQRAHGGECLAAHDTVVVGVATRACPTARTRPSRTARSPARGTAACSRSA